MLFRTPTQYFKHYLAIAVAVQWIRDAEHAGALSQSNQSSGNLTMAPVLSE